MTRICANWCGAPRGVPTQLHPCTSRLFGRIEWTGYAINGIRNKIRLLRTARRSASLVHHPDGAGCTSRAPSCVVTLNLPRLPAIAIQGRLLSARHPSARRPWRPSCSNAIGPTDSNWQGAHHICIFPSHPVDITNPPEREKRTVLTCLSYCRRLRRGHLVVRAMESAAKCLIAIGK